MPGAYTFKKRINTNSKHSAGFPGGAPFSVGTSGGNCTWWAWGRFKEVYKLATGKNLDWTAGSGNACHFYDIMGKVGYTTGKTPKPGAIICWGYYGQAHGEPGHVAFVEYVYDNGDIEISHSGYSSGPLANERLYKNKGYRRGYNNDHFNGFIYNKVEFTNPDGTVNKVVSQTTPTNSFNYDKLPNGAKETVQYLVGQKFSVAGAVGIAANISQESGFKPDAVGDKGTSFGICQWHNNRGAAMKKYVGSNWASNLTGQLAFLVHELKTSYKSTYNVVKDVPNTETGVRNAADVFVRKFEVPAAVDTRSKERQEIAVKYWKAITDGADNLDNLNGLGIDFNKTTEKLISSDNYAYLVTDAPNAVVSATKGLISQFKTINSTPSYEEIDALKVTPSLGFEKLVEKANKKISSTKKPNFNSTTNISGGTLPIYTTVVEVPFGEVTIGGVTFGTIQHKKKYTSYPNYVQSISITKTNGTINEYTIELIHQISPGDNPNYVAELISKTGYNTITISYGDANSGEYFADIAALVTDVKTTFNFNSYNIQYTIIATSLSYLLATTKKNFPAIKSKPSSVIINLLKDESSGLTKYFTGMRNINAVMSAGYIPTNDKVIEIEAVSNKTVLEYISYLTALMKNEDEKIADNSTYYFTINDEYNYEGSTFSIKEVIANNIITNNIVYDVDVGYPDANLVFDFNVTSDYAWALAYQTANKITTYKYDINYAGKLVTTKTSPVINSTLGSNQFNIDSNTWKQLTRFPINATLTTKELLSPIFTLSYIRINNYYFGNKRITSGLYIVVEQKDTISSNGCRTTLGLTRVASDAETLTTEGRVIT